MRGTGLVNHYYATVTEQRDAIKRAERAGIDLNNHSEVTGFLKTERHRALLTGNCWVGHNGHIQERGCGG